VRDGVVQKHRSSDGVDRLTMQWRIAANQAIAAFLQSIVTDERTRAG
jgi:hypothetical protein